MMTNLRTGERKALEAEHAHFDSEGRVFFHSHSHSHVHEHVQRRRVISLEQKVLAKNDRAAGENRAWLQERGILAFNLVSSPGAGKTTILERTIRDLGTEFDLAVVEGDQHTLNDARRIEAQGAPVVQINTGTACHLDAEMVARGIHELVPAHGAVVFIENVGNLVCPALFDLGERAKVAIVSVTEGEDKPVKYPHMFRAARLMLLNKVDLLPHLSFDVEKCLAYAREVNPSLEVIRVSATRGDGLGDWYEWIRSHRSVDTLSGERS
jgi:hydrogenase nickel incorporation protein HypB